MIVNDLDPNHQPNPDLFQLHIYREIVCVGLFIAQIIILIYTKSRT
jgi:hypothetical protein